jgi:NH3-dependent NAD+ synthetase
MASSMACAPRAADVTPVAHLDTTPVHQRAAHLGSPEELRRRTPTALDPL